MKSFRAIGLMSGTSMDGLDLADVTFHLSEEGKWNFEINGTEWFAYTVEMREKLKSAFTMSAPELTELSAWLGRYYAEKVNAYFYANAIDKKKIRFIASHGQTVFHQPEKGYTLQIGNGPELAVFTECATVVDFRTKDVALGGNGAPLIPVADFFLFKEYADSFLNLGGFANLSFLENETVFSFDVCPINIVVNHLMSTIGKEYDESGELGRRGEVNQTLLEELNSLAYYQQEGPKSLGWEWVETEFFPIFSKDIPLKDKIRTLYEHYAIQIAHILNEKKINSVLITGGGAKNSFLVEKIEFYTNGKIVLPNSSIIDFKEALGFAFLGVLRWLGKPNVLKSVTGAKRDSCSGQIIRP